MPLHIEQRAGACVEAGIYLLLLGAGVVLVHLNVIGLNGATRLSVVLLLFLLIVAWKRFEGGRHPCFLFLALLSVFQAGRLIAFAAGILEEPFRCELATAVPFDIDSHSAATTLLVIMLAAICVYVPCRWGYRSVILNVGKANRFLPAIYLLLFLTFPFALYKNWVYFDYIRSHGGYLSVYTDNSGIINSAGTLVRTLSVFCYNTFLLAYVIERRRRQICILTTSFVAISVLDLLIGFRGKFFLFLLLLWFLHILKTGRKMRLVGLVCAGITLSVGAVMVANFRENRATEMLSPLGFVAQQGISMQVTEVSIAFPDQFRRNALRYIANDLKNGFVASPSLGPGELLDNDLSIFLNREGYSYGFATGSAYLAQSYLLGGIAGVVFASLLIGLALHGLHLLGRNTIGAVVLSALLPAMIYLPRSGLLTPISTGAKALAALALVIPTVLCVDWVRGVFTTQVGPLRNRVFAS